MGRRRLLIATSLDGYVADADASVGWLHPFQDADQRERYDPFFASVGALLMGATTYDQVPGLGGWAYGETPAWVMTHRERPRWPGARVNFRRGSVAEVVAEIEEATSGDLWLVGGPNLVAQCLEARLLDDLLLSLVPVVLGAGVSLWAGAPPSRVEHVRAEGRPSGRVELEYRLER